MNKVGSEHYEYITQLYNEQGTRAVCKFLRETLGVACPSPVIKRLKHLESLGYNSEKDVFERNPLKEAESLFLGLDELCNSDTKIKRETRPRTNSCPDKASALESMIHSLVEERLLEISKYVVLDPISKHIVVDRDGMLNDGYNVIIN